MSDAQPHTAHSSPRVRVLERRHESPVHWAEETAKSMVPAAAEEKAGPINFAGTPVSDRVGNTSDSAVQHFWEAVQGRPVRPNIAVLEQQSQRLKQASNRRPEWGAQLHVTDKQFTQFKSENYTTAADLAGIALDREQLKNTPKSRIDHVIRPGFYMRAQKQMAQAEKRGEREAEARLAWQRKRQEQTREKMHQRVKEREMREAERAYPVQLAAAAVAAKEARAAEASVSLAAAEQGAAELNAFERSVLGREQDESDESELEEIGEGSSSECEDGGSPPLHAAAQRAPKPKAVGTRHFDASFSPGVTAFGGEFVNSSSRGVL